MDITLASGAIKPLRRNDKLVISNLLFVDDLLVLCKGDTHSAKGIIVALEKLQQYTSLAINKQKSKVFFSKGCKNKEVIAEIVGVLIGSLPMKYLGLPLTSIYPKARHFSPLIDKVRSYIEGWQLQYLSVAGRAELIKRVLHNVISYWYQSQLRKN